MSNRPREDAYIGALQAHRFVLQARFDVIKAFVMNQDFQFERNCIRKQLELIDAEIAHKEKQS
jgi:hypothetical protein